MERGKEQRSQRNYSTNVFSIPLSCAGREVLRCGTTKDKVRQIIETNKHENGREGQPVHQGFLQTTSWRAKVLTLDPLETAARVRRELPQMGHLAMRSWVNQQTPALPIHVSIERFSPKEIRVSIEITLPSTYSSCTISYCPLVIRVSADSVSAVTKIWMRFTMPKGLFVLARILSLRLGQNEYNDEKAFKDNVNKAFQHSQVLIYDAIVDSKLKSTKPFICTAT